MCITGLMALPSQFKNQYSFTNILFHKEDYGSTADWNFFATSHGKGENDGVGGDVKIQFGEKCCSKRKLLVIQRHLSGLQNPNFQALSLKDSQKRR